MMKFKEGDVIYLVPIRFWETQEPIRCVVLQSVDAIIYDTDAGSTSIYVNHGEYEHPVYISSRMVFYSPDNARRVADHLKAIHELRSEDQMIPIMAEIMARLGE